MNFDSGVFYTNDIANIKSFYEDLGFTLSYYQPERFISFIFENGCKLGIKQRKEEREVPGSQTIFVVVEELEEFYQKLHESGGYNINKPLTKDDWAMNFSILDPDGNKVEFCKYYEN